MTLNTSDSSRYVGIVLDLFARKDIPEVLTCRAEARPFLQHKLFKKRALASAPTDCRLIPEVRGAGFVWNLILSLPPDSSTSRLEPLVAPMSPCAER